MQKRKARPDLIERNFKHGLCSHRLYRIHNAMKNRCYNTKQLAYKNYGERGIIVCDEWHDFVTFYNWSIENGYEDGLTLDRVDNNGSYEPANCRWVTAKINNHNRKNSVNITAFGETKNAVDWIEDERCKTSYWSLIYRINNGWDAERALSTPSRRKGDGFRQFKTFYQFVKEKYPKVLKEFHKQKSPG